MALASSLCPGACGVGLGLHRLRPIQKTNPGRSRGLSSVRVWAVRLPRWLQISHESTALIALFARGGHFRSFSEWCFYVLF